ncbi:MAG: DUF445 domain-containing protein [Sulfurospirillum sp.]|nr:DUF445 domain-containing protein [Sulfurospirillum sp.]
MQNKSLVTDIISLLFIAISFFIPQHVSHLFLFVGLFALSGALTNQIAIYMLFEKVPLFYGSGVIELRFEAFKKSIKILMMEQFFTQEKLNDFFSHEQAQINFEPIIEDADFSLAYDALTKTVMESSFGSMLGMFGGVGVLENLREPFTCKLKDAVKMITQSKDFKTKLNAHLQTSSLSEDMLISIENIIDKRLDELTPKMVKQIVQDFIKEHLGWLVIWGGFFGGTIGLISALMMF